jgi:hypothetical protein
MADKQRAPGSRAIVATDTPEADENIAATDMISDFVEETIDNIEDTFDGENEQDK